MSNLDLIRGRQVVEYLTNQSGGSVAAGDVVYLDTGHDEAFITGTTSAYTGAVGVAFESIASGAQGRVVVQGYVPLINVNASVTRGHYGSTFTVAKQATDAGASRAAGTFCQFLTGGTTPSATLFGAPDVSLGGGGGSGALTLISTYTAAGSTSVATFSSIAGTYNSLLLVYQARSAAANSSFNDLHLTFNSDTAANYDYERVGSFAGTVGSSDLTAQNFFVTFVPGDSATAGVAASGEILIPNYAGTAFQKGFHIRAEFEANQGASMAVYQWGGRWRSTSAITRIDINCCNGQGSGAPAANFVTGSKVWLYGIT